MTTRRVMSVPEPKTCVSLASIAAAYVSVREGNQKEKKRGVFLLVTAQLCLFFFFFFLKQRGMLALEIYTRVFDCCTFVIQSDPHCLLGACVLNQHHRAAT